MSDALSRLFDQLGGNRRVMMVLVGIGALGVIWAFSRWAMAPVWVPLYQGIPVETVGRITDRLGEDGIGYRLDAGGTAISVPQDDAARARVVLAAEGLPRSGRPGFELFDEPAWGMTDFTQRINYRRALEGELERTISRMRGIESAQVHLALRQASVLRRNEQPAEASVVLGLNSGVRPENAIVEGIASLVASSVEGMEPEHVRVLDDTGRLLSAEAAPGSPEGLSDRQIQIQRDVEAYLEQRAEALVAQYVGPGNATIRVSAQLNFDRLDRTVQAVDPEQQVTVQEDRAEIIPGSEEQGASSVTTNSVFESTRSVETFSRGGTRIERLTVAVLVSDRAVPAADGGADAEPAFEPRSPRELSQVEALVRNAVGFSGARGDEISVISVPMAPAPFAVPAEEGLDILGIVQALQRPAIGLAGAALALFLALKVLATLKAAPREQKLALAPAPQAEAGLPAHPPAAAVRSGAEPRPAAAAPPPPPRELKVQDPLLTARVIRSWMSEAS